MKDKRFQVRGEYTTTILQLSRMNLKSFSEIWDADHKNCLVELIGVVRCITTGPMPNMAHIIKHVHPRHVSKS